MTDLKSRFPEAWAALEDVRSNEGGRFPKAFIKMALTALADHLVPDGFMAVCKLCRRECANWKCSIATECPLRNKEPRPFSNSWRESDGVD